jgi:SAM-dependent methyltransferase
MNQTLIDYYNQEYTRYTPDRLIEDREGIKSFLYENIETLLQFFNNYQQDAKPFSAPFSSLELGCGLAYLSHHLVKKGAVVSAVDVSSMAINCARELASSESVEIDLSVRDLTIKQEFDEQYDLIIDSHLLHCIVEDDERKQYFNNARSALKENGVFLIETMVYQPRMQIPVDYFLDEDFKLSKSIDGESVAIRRIKSTREIEEELLEAGFKIQYLYYHNELAFQVFNEEPDYPFEWLPRTLRVAVSKA